jgi:hypothetical protein
MFGRKGNPLQLSVLEKVQEGYPRSLSEFDNQEKWGVLRHIILKSEAPKLWKRYTS